MEEIGQEEICYLVSTSKPMYDGFQTVYKYLSAAEILLKSCPKLLARQQ